MNAVALERGLPSWIEAEQVILGSLIQDQQAHAGAFQVLKPDDFSTERHRRIYTTMAAMDAAGDEIGAVTLAAALVGRKWLESVDGLTYLSTLWADLPAFPSIEKFIDGVREKAALRRLIFASQAIINRCLEPGENSAAIIAGAENSLSEIGQPDSDAAELLTPGEVVEKAGGLDAFMNPRQGGGIATPWRRLTDLTSGWRPGEVFVVAGNPGAGKSSILLQAACGVAETGMGAMIFSLEMTRAALVQRMACSRARVDSGKLRGGYLNIEERSRVRRAIGEFANWPLWIAEHGIATVSGMRSAIRRKKAKRNLFLVSIDYLQLMQAIGRQSNRHAELSEITRALKLLAMTEEVNVHLGSQLSRDNMKEKRAPVLSDLRESGSIEENADAVSFVWREEMLRRDREDLRGLAELILAKQRNGPVGKVQLVFLQHLTRFESLAEDLRGGNDSQRRFDHDD